MAASWEAVAGLQCLEAAGRWQAEAAGRRRVLLLLLEHRCVFNVEKLWGGHRQTTTRCQVSLEVTSSQNTFPCEINTWFISLLL